MHKLLTLLTACMLVSDFTFASVGVGDAVRFNDLTIINNEGGNTPPVPFATPIPFANVSLRLAPDADPIMLANNTQLGFNFIQSSIDKLFSLNTRTGVLTLKASGLYEVEYFFSIQNRERDRNGGVGAIYATLNGKVIPGSQTVRSYSSGTVGNLTNLVTFEADAGDQLAFFFTSRRERRERDFSIPTLRRERLIGPIADVDWEPLSYGITLVSRPGR